VRALEGQLAAATEDAALARGRAERAEARGANAETLEPLLEETAAELAAARAELLEACARRPRGAAGSSCPRLSRCLSCWIH